MEMIEKLENSVTMRVTGLICLTYHYVDSFSFPVFQIGGYENRFFANFDPADLITAFHQTCNNRG